MMLTMGSYEEYECDKYFLWEMVEGTAGTAVQTERKVLELSEYFAEYEDGVLPSVWQTGQVDGGLYAIPYSCQVITLVTGTDVVGDRHQPFKQ